MGKLPFGVGDFIYTRCSATSQLTAPMSHESFDREEVITGSTDRAFGIVFAVVFFAIGLVPAIFGGHLRVWSVAVGVAFLAVALLRPTLLAPLNALWLRFGLLLHRVVSPIVLGIMFFGVITPMGLARRLLNRDPLRLRFDAKAPTYWTERTPPGPHPQSLDHQF